MNEVNQYDCAIIGGGLGGLSLAINLAKKGHRVILFEKESYPFHKVCGEYISMESWEYLRSLGAQLETLDLPFIKQLQLSSPSGVKISRPLDLGGFGISRFKLDGMLAAIARQNNVDIREGCKVENLFFEHGAFTIKTANETFSSKVCCGSFGKRSNLDIKWKRKFTRQRPGALNNYIGVKYHVRYPVDADTIYLHNFQNGYCGLSRIDDGLACLCYLTTADNLKRHGNSIAKMEERILQLNPELKTILEKAERVYASPLSISQVSFEKKTIVENHVLMVGDSAGMITPLCGNGMSMAMHAGKIAAEKISAFLLGKFSRQEMEDQYESEWKKTFAGRLRTGRLIQRFFGKKWLTEIFVFFMKRFPDLADNIIRKTHGKPF